MSLVSTPVRPDEVVAYLTDRCTYPATLVVAAPSARFVELWSEGGSTDATDAPTTLHQVAVARHIRVVFAPTVVHLRAVLAAFDPDASRVVPPPVPVSSPNRTRPKLVVYNLVQSHRDTSEWSVQGLAATAAVLAEAGWRTGMHVVVADSSWDAAAGETLPVLSTSARRQLEKAGYTQPVARIETALARWFALVASLGVAETDEVEVAEVDKKDEAEVDKKDEKDEMILDEVLDELQQRTETERRPPSARIIPDSDDEGLEGAPEGEKEQASDSDSELSDLTDLSDMPPPTGLRGPQTQEPRPSQDSDSDSDLSDLSDLSSALSDPPSSPAPQHAPPQAPPQQSQAPPQTAPPQQSQQTLRLIADSQDGLSLSESDLSDY